MTKLTETLPKKNKSHEYVLFVLIKTGVKYLSMAHLPPPLFNVVPLATMFVGTRKRPNNVKGGGGGGSGYLKTPLFRKVSKQFCRRLQVNTAYPKRSRRHTLPSRCINFKDKKSLIFDFILSLSLSQLRAIARKHVSYQ